MKVQRKPVTKDFKLESDPDGEAVITVRQSSTGDTIRRAELFSETTRIIDDDQLGQVQLKQKWNIHEQRRFEAFLTLVQVNGIEDEDGNPVFKTRDTKDGPRLAMNERSFNEAWGLLPDEVAIEIHNLVLEVNPHWNPNAVGE